MDLIAIGKIMGAHGIRGDLKVMPYNADTSLFSKDRVVFLKDGQDYRQYRIDFSAASNKGIRIHLEGIQDRDSAKSLFRSEIFFPRSEFEPLSDGEYYVVDLMGLEAIDSATGKRIGIIKDLMETPGHDCFVIHNGKNEILVPVIDNVVQDLDTENQTVTLVLPEGLLEIYEN